MVWNSAFDSYIDYREEVLKTHAPKQAKSILNETQTGLLRWVASQWGFSINSKSRKMSAADVQSAEAHLKSIPVTQIQQARVALAEAFRVFEVSKASQNTYGNRVYAFVDWVEKHPFFPLNAEKQLQDQCCPPRRLSGRRHYAQLPLTSRRGPYLAYALTPEETPPALQAELDDWERFLSAPYYPGRFFEPILPSTAQGYIKIIRLMLGFKHRYAREPIPIDELRLHHLFPVVTEDDLEPLPRKQQKRLYKMKQLDLENFLAEFFEFTEVRNSAKSPRSQLSKLCALKRLGHKLYCLEVADAKEYDAIPIFATLAQHTRLVVQKIKMWRKTRTYVANQERKWPSPVEGETALTTLKRTVVEPLRLKCRPRRKNKTLREGDVIAISLQHYLKWGFMTERPARRQQDYRSLKLSLSCPIERPTEVPPDGFWFPLPPPEDRVKYRDGRVGDNYLYHTYSYQGEFYPSGVWVMELCSFKTAKSLGVFSMRLPNRDFGDGTCFYDYLENYLCGLWLPGGYKNLSVYDWYDPNLMGKKGRWVTKGWMEFEPMQVFLPPSKPNAHALRWGYVFPVPTKGKEADGNSFGGSFTRTSYQAIGKRISPHMVRYMWATWGFQVRLADHEMRSLAFAMGHSVETLRDMYERCTPEEKLRAIEEAIDSLMFDEMKTTPEGMVSNLVRLAKEIQNLSPYEREQLQRLQDQ